MRELQLHVEEDCAPCGPCVGALYGTGKFWCMCQGLYKLWCVRRGSEEELEFRFFQRLNTRGILRFGIWKREGFGEKGVDHSRGSGLWTLIDQCAGKPARVRLNSYTFPNRITLGKLETRVPPRSERNAHRGAVRRVAGRSRATTSTRTTWPTRATRSESRVLLEDAPARKKRRARRVLIFARDSAQPSGTDLEPRTRAQTLFRTKYATGLCRATVVRARHSSITGG